MKAEIVNGKAISVKEINGQRLITFKEIDEVHERPDGTAKRNFSENRKRFIKNEDYYTVKPSDLQNHEIRTSEINISQVTNRGTTFLTESGYLMIVKSLNDDLAWKVQRELVSTYFRAKEILNPQQEFINQQLQNLMLQQTQFFQTAMQTLRSHLPQPIYPQRTTPFKTRIFAKLDLLSNHYTQPLSKIIHSAIIEMEDIYDICLADYQTQYLVQTRVPQEQMQIIDVIEYHHDIAKLFSLTVDNILNQNNIPYEHTKRRENIFAQTNAS